MDIIYWVVLLLMSPFIFMLLLLLLSGVFWILFGILMLIAFIVDSIIDRWSYR